MEDRTRSAYTIEEWAALEAERADVRYEYVYGHLIAMAGGTLRHAEVKSEVADAVRQRTRKRCIVTESDVRVETVGEHVYRLPDVVVYCDAPRITAIPGVGEALQNPTLLVEVLSKHSVQDDLENKLAEYLTLSSLEEYWVVDPDEAFAVTPVGSSESWAYAGALQALPHDHLPVLRLVNHIPLEDYVASVVASEYTLDDTACWQRVVSDEARAPDGRSC